MASRVEMQGSNEDEEGLDEPPEVAEFLNESGEGDPRCLPPLSLVRHLRSCVSIAVSACQYSS